MRSDQLIRALTEGAILHMVRAEEPENETYWMHIEPYRTSDNKLSFWLHGWGSAANPEGVLALIISSPELFRTQWVDKDAKRLEQYHNRYIARLNEWTRNGLSVEEWEELVALEYVLTHYPKHPEANEERYKFLSDKRHTVKREPFVA